MILQTLLFPTPEICQAEELYYRQSGQEIYFDTYFNLLSIYKWLKYTQLHNLYLELEADGIFQVQFWDDKGLITQNELAVDNRTHVRIPIQYHPDSRVLYFKFIKQTEETHIYGGYYGTEMKPVWSVKIAVGICTYHRENALRKNLNLLRRTILSSGRGNLKGKLCILVSDNGRTLEPKEWQEGKDIQIFPNLNAGGVGGFTRTILEALDKQEEEGFTHIILMDDDVKLEPDAFVRTYAFLSLLREEYLDSCISGTMLRGDMKYILHETGAVWDGSNPSLPSAGVDLRKRENAFQNEKILKADYAAWWYACYSLTTFKQYGLPLPLFFHADDVEYGLRIKANVIALNGICVWHEAFENKRASMVVYYDVRNILIVNACYRTEWGFGRASKMVLRRLAPCLLRYRYKDALLVCMGVMDFCKGAEILKRNPERFNQTIVDMGYKMRPIQELTDSKQVLEQIMHYEKPEHSEQLYGRKEKKYKYLFTANGWIFPAKADKIYAYPTGVWPTVLYRKKKVLLYDPDTLKGILVEKSYRKALYCIWKCCGALVALRIHYKRRCKEFAVHEKEFTTYSFWRQYLELQI